jgi:[acyl-carrier-protein] S-malonyltransferase
VIAILCPGQGSQAPGMLSPWLERPGSGELLDRLSTAAGVDLRHLGTDADAEEIKDTAVAQPLIVAASLISLAALTAQTGPQAAWASATAGHSVGEYAAAVVAGVLTDSDALALVATRGRAMADAAGRTPTGMSAVVGGDPDEVLAALADLELVAANVNGAGQVVAAGTLDALARLKLNPPTKARVIPLAVAGAFHTEHMSSAVDAVAGAAAGLDPADPKITLLSNSDGSVADGGAAALSAMVAQISRPVRWDACQRTLADLGITAAIELAPAGVLTGLARRTLPGVETVALKTPADLDAAADLVARHTHAHQENA